MSVILGQDEILDRVDKATLDTFPRSLILFGDRGSGKHLIIDYIKDHLKLGVIDISESISQEVIDEIMVSPNPAIYFINSSQLTARKQNVLLKFLEEPLKNSYIVILTESLATLLPTIINRCQVWTLKKYEFELLSSLCDNDEQILAIATTPGQIEALKTQDVSSMFSLANTMVDRISNANYANILTITSKLDFDGKDTNKFNIIFFITTLIKVLRDKVVNCEQNNQRYVDAFILTKKLYNDTYIANINLQNLFECYLTNLKAVLR